MRSRRSILRWATRATCAAVGLSLAFACAPLLGIEDVTYGEFEGGGNGEGGNTLGEGGLDAAVDCGTKAACTSGCADLTSDGNNCGKCGFACGGPCTLSKCQEVILANGLIGPHGITADDAFAYVTVLGKSGFVVGDAGSIVRVPLGGGAAETLVSPVAEPAFIEVRDGRLVWGTFDGFGSSLVDGGDVLTLVTDAGGHFFGLAAGVDPSVFAVNPYGNSCVLARWSPGASSLALATPAACGRIVIRDGNTLYSTNVSQPGISVLALDGSPGPILAADAATWGVTQDEEYLYATESATLRKVAKDGGDERFLGEDAGLISPRIVLADGPWLYVGNYFANEVLRFSKDGGAPERIGSGARPNGMALSGGFLYWVNLGSGASTEGLKDGDVRRVRVR